MVAQSPITIMVNIIVRLKPVATIVMEALNRTIIMGNTTVRHKGLVTIAIVILMVAQSPITIMVNIIVRLKPVATIVMEALSLITIMGSIIAAHKIAILIRTTTSIITMVDTGQIRVVRTVDPTQITILAAIHTTITATITVSLK